MKKISFSISGRRFNVELDDDFAQYVLKKLFENNIFEDRDNDTPKFLGAYLKSLKENYQNDKRDSS